jgi:hypothetical protein
MENLLNELKAIEEEHQDFFKEKNLKLTQYVIISKKPVMIRFNTNKDSIDKLPDEIYIKVNNLIMTYYGL